MTYSKNILAEVSWRIFIVLCPVCIYMSTMSRQRVWRWQQVEICVADLLCNITIPQEFLFSIFAVFGIAAYNSSRGYMFPVSAVCLKSKVQIIKRQIMKAFFYSLWGMLWIVCNATVIALQRCDCLINWSQYNSAFFLETHVLSDQSFFSVLEVTVLVVFFELFNTILFFTLSMWIFNRSHIGLGALAFIYLFDASSLRMRGIYFLRYSLMYENLLNKDLLWRFGVPHIVISFSMIMILKLVSIRKDLL